MINNTNYYLPAVHVGVIRTHKTSICNQEKLQHVNLNKHYKKFTY